MKEFINGKQLGDDNLDNAVGGKLNIDNDPFEFSLVCPHCHLFVKQSKFFDHIKTCPKRKKDE